MRVLFINYEKAAQREREIRGRMKGGRGVEAGRDRETEGSEERPRGNQNAITPYTAAHVCGAVRTVRTVRIENENENVNVKTASSLNHSLNR